MSSFYIPQDSKLTLEILDSVKLESWNQTYSWTNYSELKVKDLSDATRIIEFFEDDASLFTFDDRMLVKEYITWKTALRTQTPSYMSLDAAAQNGHAVVFTDKQALVKSNPEVVVPACRVPVSQEFLHENAKGIKGVRVGADVVAASLASMTRWTGTEVAFSMPVDTMIKYNFTYAHPDGIKPLLASVVPGNSNTGMKGRVWAHYLMAEIHKMPTLQYLELTTQWCRAMFRLPKPAQNVQLPNVYKGNISLTLFQERFFYRIDYMTPSTLGSFNAAYKVHSEYEKMAQQIVEFAAARQGDSSGISMLSQSSTSWGLVSKSQVELEQTVSLIVGMAKERVVMSGYSQPELERIRNSVRKHNEKIKVWEKVESFMLRDALSQTADADEGIHVIRGRTMLDSTLIAQKVGKIRTYQKDEALAKMWFHVEQACARKNVIYFAAGLPPKGTKISIFPAGNTWASVFFFSTMEEITKAIMTETGLSYTSYKTFAVDKVWENVVKGMNNTIASWIVPPVNKTIAFTALLAPMKVDKRVMVSFSPDEDDFRVEYIEEEEDIVDPNIPSEPISSLVASTTVSVPKPPGDPAPALSFTPNITSIDD